MPSRPPPAPPRNPFIRPRTPWWERPAAQASTQPTAPPPAEPSTPVDLYAEMVRTFEQSSLANPTGRRQSFSGYLNECLSASYQPPSFRRPIRRDNNDDRFRFVTSSRTTYPFDPFTKEASMASKPVPFVFSALPFLQPTWLRGRQFSYPPSMSVLDKLASENSEPYPRVYTVDAMYTHDNPSASDCLVVMPNYAIRTRMAWDRRTQQAFFDPSRLRTISTTEVTELTRPLSRRAAPDFGVFMERYYEGEIMPVALTDSVRQLLRTAFMDSVRRRRDWLLERRFHHYREIPPSLRTWRFQNTYETYNYDPGIGERAVQQTKERYANLAEAVRRMIRLLNTTSTRGAQLLRDEDFDEWNDLLNAGSRTSAIVGAFNKARPGAMGRGEFVVGVCGHITTRTNLVATVDGSVCPDCAENRYRYCVDTQRRHHVDYAYYWESDGEHHSYAEPDEDGDDYRGNADRVMSYDTDILRHLSIDPSFKSSADGDFHMGIELETILLSPGEPDTKVREVRAELGADYLVAKYDGSLSSDRGSGIEWVTRPTNLKTHVAKLKGWGESSKGLVAWDANCCGMHTHIDSRAFTATTLGKLLQFFNAEGNVDFIRSIAGRHPDRDRQASTYAARDLASSEAATPMRALKGKESAPSRYTMINLTNLSPGERARLHVPRQHGDSTADTVEIRIYRASLSRPRLLAQIEFTHALICYCRVASFRKMNEGFFKEWLGKCTSTYPHLAAFLKVAPNKHGRRTKDAAAATAEV